MHERDNPFDLFAIAIKKTTGETVRHLPIENSRVVKYLMDHEARFTVAVTSSQYFVLPLVQGGFEISSEVGIYLPPTPINNLIFGIYNNLIQPQIYPRLESFMIGSSLQTSTGVSTPLTDNKSERKDAEKKKKKLEKNRIHSQKDIRNFLVLKASQIYVWKKPL